jgi:hypothetical protein
MAKEARIEYLGEDVVSILVLEACRWIETWAGQILNSEVQTEFLGFIGRRTSPGAGGPTPLLALCRRVLPKLPRRESDVLVRHLFDEGLFTDSGTSNQGTRWKWDPAVRPAFDNEEHPLVGL